MLVHNPTIQMDKLAKHHGAGLKLQPITSLPEENQAAMRSELHMQTEDGKWVVGLEANVRAWQHTRYGNAASLMLHPALRWAAELGYRSWLVWYQWMRRRREAKV